MKKVTKEQTLHGFEGFNAVSNEELEKVDGGEVISAIVAAGALAYTIGYGIGVTTRRLYDGTF